MSPKARGYVAPLPTTKSHYSNHITVPYGILLVLLILTQLDHIVAAGPSQHGGFVAMSTLGVGFQHVSAAATAPAALQDTPRFDHALYNVSIAENSVGKTFAVQPPNEERLGIRIRPDWDVRFRIVGGDKDKLFKAEDRVVGDFAFLAIRTRTGNVILNREKIDEYRLEVKASITQRDTKSNIVVEAETSVCVRVLDTNDLSPMFYPNSYSVSVAEDMALHKSIIQVVAEDADLGINGEIYYSFLEGNDYFAVHPSSGVITLTRPLKFTDRSFHDLVVVATDRGSTGSSRLGQASKAKVHVTVKPVSKLLFTKFLRQKPVCNN